MNNNESSPSASFGQYGKNFQEKIVQALLTDPKWAEQVMDVFDSRYFDQKYLQYLAEKYFKYARQYKDFPSLQMLVTIIKDELRVGADRQLAEQIVDYLQRVKATSNAQDIPFVKDKTLDFCRKQALKGALEKAVDLVGSEKYEAVVDLIKNAVSVGTVSSLGHDLQEDIEARCVALERHCVPTGVSQLDDKEITQGGLGRGELGCIIANTGVGKCVFATTFINVKYTAITINGRHWRRYRPWERVYVERGHIYARDICDTDVSSITREVVTERIQIGELFESLGITAFPPNDGEETLVEAQFDISIESTGGFYPIEAFRMTGVENVSLVRLLDGTELLASPDHLVLKAFGDRSVWVRLRELSPGDTLETQVGPREVSYVSAVRDISDRLYDLQVATVHSYYTNGILSHNSHWLTMLGANALRLGKNVLHYTFELSEAKVGIRYDSNLCDIDSNLVVENMDKVKEYYAGAKIGRLKIKYYPTGTATVYTLRSHIEKLSLKGFRPDLVLIDYADIMRSSRQYDSLRHELKLIYEELRSYADELGVPIWTCSQSNKDGAESEIIDLSNMSEAYGKAFVADLIVSISRRATEKSSGWGRLYIAKNRFGRDGLIFPLKIDTARSKFEIMGDTLSHAEVKIENEKDFKQMLKQKWDNLKNDGIETRKLGSEIPTKERVENNG